MLALAPMSRGGGGSTACVRAICAIVVLDAGLLRRAYAYYAWRGCLSFALLGLGIATTWLLSVGPVSIVVNAVLLAFGSIQVALIGHDAGHLAVFKSTRANWMLGWVCWSLVLGVGFWYWYDRHNRHHASTNDLQADPDLQWASMVAYTEDAVRLRQRSRRGRWLVRWQAVLGPLYTLGLAFAFRVEAGRSPSASCVVDANSSS